MNGSSVPAAEGSSGWLLEEVCAPGCCLKMADSSRGVKRQAATRTAPSGEEALLYLSERGLVAFFY